MSTDQSPEKVAEARAAAAANRAAGGWVVTLKDPPTIMVPDEMQEAFEERLHPRGRGGKWRKVIADYVGPGGYARVNGLLRGTLDSNIDPQGNLQEPLGAREAKALKEKIAIIDDAFREAMPLKKPITVWRGMRFGLEDVRVGDDVGDNAYVSTSRERDFAETYADEDGTLLKIEVPAGTRALDVDEIAGSEDWRAREKELLLDRGLSMIVTKVEKRDKGRLVTARVQPRAG